MSKLSAEQEAEAQALAERISRATADDLLEVARLLVANPSDRAFGRTEFQLRDLVHRIGAKALQLHLAEKKTATKDPA